MKIFFLLLLIYNTNLFADTSCIDLGILSQEADLTNIHCHMQSRLKKPNPEFCKSCDVSDDILNKAYMKDISNKEVLLELHKTIAQPLLDTFKIGNVKDFNIEGCSYQSLVKSLDKYKGCAEDNKDLVQQYKNTVALEMARLASKVDLNSGTLSIFRRSFSNNSCNLSEAETLAIESKNLEQNINKESLEKMALIALQNPMDVELAIQESTNISVEARNTFRHPLIRNILLKNPQEIITFLKNKKSITSDQITKWIYNKNNIANLSKSSNLHCKNSFETVAASICNDDFKHGNVSFNSYTDFSKNVDEKYKDHTTALYCSQFKNSSIDMEKMVSEGLKESQLPLSRQSEESFRDKFFTTQVSEKKEQMCSALSTPCTDNKSPQCQLAQDVKKATENNVSSFDKETIKKLRDILGPDVQADESTRKTLIASGIMTEKDFSQIPPSANVTAAPSPIDPSKEREIMGTSPSKTIVPVNQNMAGANISPYSSYNGNASYSSTTQEETRETYRERSPVLPPSTAEYIKQMSSMNRDLLDRLVKERGAKDKYTSDEIKEQLARMSKERDLPLPLDQQAQFFDHEWSDVAPKVMPLIPDDLKAKDGNGRRIASISTPLTGKALQQKRYDDQRNSALEQFGKGADNSAPITDSSAVTMSVNNELLLKKVRLDVPDEKLEKLNLSVILDQKLGTDKEGKKLKGLIDNKQSFMLDIEGKVAFMVEYSESKKGFELKALKNNLPPEVFEKIKTQVSSFLSKNERKHEYSALKEELQN